MAKVNLSLLNLDMDSMSDNQAIRKIASYLYIQNEQLRYELTHIDEENMSPQMAPTTQGMTQAQIQKAIEDATRKQPDIDLSSNPIIINLQRKLDNMGKLQEQTTGTVQKLTTEMGEKVSMTTYNAGLKGLQALINGQTTIINTLSTNFSEHLTAYNQFRTSYNAHKHQMTIDSDGVISMGGPTANPTNPNISDTAYFRAKVSEARQSGYTEAQRDWRPDNISQTGNKVVVLNYEGDTIGGPYTIYPW